MSSKKTYRKYAATTMAAAAAVASVAPIATAAETNGFPDVSTGHTHYDGIMAMSAAGVIEGYTDSTFRPNNVIKRAGVAKMIQKAAKLPTPENVDEVLSVYTDVGNESAEDRNAIAAVTLAGIMGGKAGGKFDPWGSVKREQMAQILVRAFKLDEIKTDNDVEVKDMDKVSPNFREYVQIVANLGVSTPVNGVYDPHNTVKRGQFATFTNRSVNAEAPAEGLKVESVSAIKAKGIEVTFNNEIDTTKASIVVKKGNVTVNVDSIEFADDKKSAVINTTTKLTKGEYTVTVSGLTEEALVASFEAENEKVADINVLSETAPLNPAAVAGGIGGVNYQANETAFVNYEVLNQYGEKMSNQGITWTQSTGGKVADNGKGQLTIGNTANAGVAFIPGNKVFLTGVHGNTATVVNAEVTIGLEAKVAEVEFKGVYNTTKNKLEDLPAGFANNNYVLLFEAKDQYGNKIDTTVGELTLLSDNPLFIAQPTALGADVTIDDVDYKALELVAGTQVAKGGTATIQVVSNNTGKVAKYTINADALSAVTEFSISAPEELVAGTEKVEIPFTAVDQYGNAVTKHSELNGKVTLSPVASPTAGNLAFEKQQDGSAKLFYTAPANATQNDTIQTLTTLVPTNGDYSNIQLTVKPNAKPEAVIGLNEDVSTSIAADNKVEFKGEDLLVQDQYGRTLTKDQVNGWLNGANNAIVIESDNGAGAITVTSTNADGTNLDGFNFVETSGETFTVAATAVAGANTEKLIFSLATGATPPAAANVISASSKSVTFTRVAQSEYASYEVADLGVMYNDASVSSATDGKYNVKPKVYGVTEAGKKVLLPAAKYSITTNGKLDVSTPGEIADLAALGYDAPDFKDANGNAKDITVKVTIMVEDGNGAAAATIEKDLVVSNATPVAETVTLTDKVVSGAAFVDKEALNNDEPGGGATLTNAALNAFIDEIKDQYGVVITPDADITISKVEKVDGSNFAVTDNGKDDVKITGATEGDKFTATYKYVGGKTVSVNFVVSDN